MGYNEKNKKIRRSLNSRVRLWGDTVLKTCFSFSPTGLLTTVSFLLPKYIL
jgi:hypothetical protein